MEHGTLDSHPSQLGDRQALATAIAKAARGVEVTVTQQKSFPLRDADLGRDIGKDLGELAVHAPAITNELEKLPPLGSSKMLPGEGPECIRPEARVRLIAFGGAIDTAVSFAEWARAAPAWLELRAVELQGHGTRAAEGVWPLGQRDTTADAGEEEDEAAAALFDDVTAARAAAVTSLVDLIEPLCSGAFALYGFSSGAMLAYLITLELQRRAAAAAAEAANRLPFRLIVCGRGAPHCVHTAAAFWQTLRRGSDDEVLALLNQKIGVPLESEPEAIRHKAALWRASIVPAMVHVGTSPKVGSKVDFPLAADEASAAEANVYATGAPPVTACPMLAIGSNGDKVWRWDTPRRWADVAGYAGFRLDAVDGVAHFKLMASKPVVDTVARELCGAELAQARFG